MNSIEVGFDGDFYQIEKSNDDLEKGQLGIITTDFKTTDATNMYLAVCMDGKPAFVMHGKPNGEYHITTRPTYYIAVTEHIEGNVIEANYTSKVAKFDF
jgi:hypothetical protein